MEFFIGANDLAALILSDLAPQRGKSHLTGTEVLRQLSAISSRVAFSCSSE